MELEDTLFMGCGVVMAGGVVFAEDTAIVILVMVFGTEDAAFEEREYFGGEQHGEERSRNINPQ